MSPFLAVVLAVSFAGSDSESQAIARRAVINFEKDTITALRYEYMALDEKKGKGVEVNHVMTVGGTPYERLVSKNGGPLPPKAEKQQEEKFRKTLQFRRNELKSQHDNRVRKWKEQNRFLEEAPDAFEITMLPETVMNGRAVYTIECKPKAGYQPRDERGKMFGKIEAKAWIDKADRRIVKLDADSTDSISIGWILERVAKGTHMELEQMRLPDGNWVLKTVSIGGSARIMVVDNKQLDETLTYSGYRAAPDLKPVK
jgi:hypothetical protein